ncbi:MAG TPA: MATE family efflux transporter, partial [Sutterella sp.]|nr:MATE family efflux transporter [Sutterella sp.]
MLEGSIWDKMVVFALPLAFTGILQQLYNAADVATLGHFVSSESMAAVGSNVPVIGLIISLCMGLALGANVFVARMLGMKDKDAASRAVHTAFIVSIFFGLVATALGEIFTRPVLLWLDVPESVFEHAENYLRVYLLAMPFIAIYNFLAAVFRSKGNTQTPLMALFVASVFNIVANLVFVMVFNMQAGGVALATTLANAISAVILVINLVRRDDEIRLNLKSILPIDQAALNAIVRIGLPAGIQGMVFSLSNVIIQGAINSLGPEVMAASVAAFTIEINVYCFINAFGLAATTYVSQNYGARQFARCRRATWISMGLNMIATALIVALILFFGRQLLGFFSDSGNVIELGMIRILLVVVPEPINV